MRRLIAIPIVILVLALIAGSAFAAYDFLSIGVETTVKEPLVIEYRYNDIISTPWVMLENDDCLYIAGYAGDEISIDLRIMNKGSASLTVSTLIVGETNYFTFGGFPPGNPDSVITSEGVWQGTVTVGINGDAPVGTYNLAISFLRS